MDLRVGSETVLVRPANDPRLELEPRPCSTPQEEFQRICSNITVPLERLRVSADGTVYPGIRPEHVSRATLRLDDYVLPTWRPTFGIGMSFFGPAVVAAMDAQWLPFDELALQAGLPIGTHMIGGYGAFRLRPVPGDRLRPWIGAFATGVCLMGTDQNGESRSSCAGAVAGRIGVDWAFESGTILLSPELDVLFPIDGYLGIEWAVAPWGGFTISWMY